MSGIKSLAFIKLKNMKNKNYPSVYSLILGVVSIDFQFMLLRIGEVGKLDNIVSLKRSILIRVV